MTDRTRDSDGRAPVVRLFSSAASLARGGCPTHRRTRADHAVRRDPRRAPPLADSPLVPLDAVLDLVEHRGHTVEDACSRLPAPGHRCAQVLGARVAPPHAGLLAWVRHGARSYLDGLAADQARDGLDRSPVADFWVRQYLPGGGRVRPYEVCARGRGYAYRDGADRVRELRLPVLAGAGGRPPPDAEVAVAAYVLATGAGVDREVLAARPGRYEGGVPFPMRGRRGGPADDRDPPDRVRVVRASCLDSSTAVLFDGTVPESADFFDRVGREGLRSALVGGARVPGDDCVSCGVRSGCGRLPRAPGILGVHDRSRPRRSWSAAGALRFRECPARAHFDSLGLPGDAPGAAAGTRAASGRDLAVRARLELLHGRHPRRACGLADLPEDPDCWSAGGWALRGEEARRGAAMIAAHLGVCPLDGLRSGSQVRVGRTVAADDTRADVLVLARPDLLLHREGAWSYREITTATGDLPGDERRLMERRPGLAVAVLLFACGAIPLESGSAVELEVLTPEGARVRTIDPGTAWARTEARQVVNALAAPWHRDLSYAPVPGRACRDCPYRRWCPAQSDPTEEPDPVAKGTGEPGVSAGREEGPQEQS